LISATSSSFQLPERLVNLAGRCGLEAGNLLVRKCAITTTSSAWPGTRAPTRLNGRTASSRGGYHPDISGDELSVYVADCLADEVDVDFPSVLTVLDRMRQSFFGGPPGWSPAPTFVVTPQEAFWGAIVPLSVPVRARARGAAAAAKVWNDWCVECAGVGDLPDCQGGNLRIPAGVQDGRRLRFRLVVPGIRETLVDARVVIK